MADAGAWEETPVLSFLNRQVRSLLLRSGVEAKTFPVPGIPGGASYYAAGPPASDEPIVFVHGLADSSHTWVRVLRPLSTLRRVYAVDLLGHGWTPPPERGWATLEEQVDLLEAFRREVLGDRTFTLVGHSLGGWVAAKYATRRPPGLARLVLVENAGLMFEGVEEHLELLRVESARDVERLWRTALHRVPWVLRLFRTEVAALYRSPPVRGTLENWTVEDAITDDDLGAIQATTVIVWGCEDGLTPPHLVDRLVTTIPDARVEWIEGCGHGPQLEKPGRLLEVLKRAIRTEPAALRSPPRGPGAPSGTPGASPEARTPGSSGTP